MTFKLEFRTDSVAFDGYLTDEISRILRQLTRRLENGDPAGVIRDVNGTVIGEYELTDE